MSPFFKLFLNRSAYWANTCTSTAIEALVSVDNVFAVSCRDSANRALSFTAAAVDAFITNYICHWKTPP